MSTRSLLVILLLLLAFSSVLARGSGRPPDVASQQAGFEFVRVRYDSVGGRNESYYYYEGRLWERWETDYPQADENFVFRLQELTTAKPNLRAITTRLSDEDLFQFPFIYMCDVGWMELTRTEKRRLREYLQKGGFLWVDDFWGWGEWRNFERIMEEVLPDSRWQPIPSSHAILRTVFPLESLPQVPARDFAVSGWTHDPPYYHRYPPIGIEEVNFRGYFDDLGRLMVVATHNTDIGDGWEREGYGEWYFEKYSTVSYAAGVNIVVYALSH